MAYYNRDYFGTGNNSSSNGGGNNGDVRHARTVGALRAFGDEQHARNVGALRAFGDEQHARNVGALRAFGDEQHARNVGALRAAADDTVDRVNGAKEWWYEAISVLLGLIFGAAFGIYAAKVLFAVETVDAMGNSRLVTDPNLYVLDVILGVALFVFVYLVLHLLPFGKKRRQR